MFVEKDVNFIVFFFPHKFRGAKHISLKLLPRMRVHVILSILLIAFVCIFIFFFWNTKQIILYYNNIDRFPLKSICIYMSYIL